jgi:glycosyltransferase involved in cell wall biosynthesis
MRPAAPLALYGALILGLGIGCSVLAAILSAFALALEAHAANRLLLLLLASNCTALLGTALMALDVICFAPARRAQRSPAPRPPEDLAITVVLTAYNDELSIGLAVRDFSAHRLVRRVLVIDNDSSDRTPEVAAREGATVIRELRRGYGQCVFRALTEGACRDDTPVTVLCEGDMTFRAADIDKLVAYYPHADIVNGTRIVEQLRARKTQLTTFMYYGNFFVGKLLELRHLGNGTFTDVGTTYKLCRNSALRKLLPYLDREVNLEFNAHFMDMALQRNLSMVECPIAFYDRVGVSKGGNASDWRALCVGLKMIAGIVLGWQVFAIGRPRGSGSGNGTQRP